MALGTFISGLTGLFGSRQQIDAQRKENQETREYNLNLARLQNRWNVEQWHRENAYNSPAAQMARFAAAGLNPNLIYGQTNTAPQLSGSMSSGAPASPTDLSAMGKSTEAMSKMFGSFGDALMQLPMYREQLRSIKLDNDNKEIGLNEQKYQQDIRRFVRRLNYSTESLESLLNYGAGNDEWQNDEGVNPMYNNPDVRKYLMEYYQHHRKFTIDKGTEQAIIDSILADARLSDAEAEKAKETLKSTIKAINQNNVNNIDFSEIERSLNLGKGALSLIKLIVEILK